VSRIVRGYTPEGHKLWTDLGPADYMTFGPLGGRSIVDATSAMAPVIRPQTVKVQKRRDYAASVAKGHATRRARHGL
jgi:hypothetical protein